MYRLLTVAFFACALTQAALAENDSVPANAAAGITTPATTAAPAAAPATAPVDQDNVVSCKYEGTTGTLFKSRICHTQREWKEREAAARELIDRLQTTSSTNGTGGN